MSEVTKRVLVVMLEPDEKRSGLTRAYCVDPDCYVTGSWRVVINSNPFKEVRLCEAEKSAFMNSARNTPHPFRILRPRAEMSQRLVTYCCQYSKGPQFGRRL